MTKTLTLAIGIIILLAPFTFAAPPDPVAHFEKSVRPMLIEKCYACHGPDKQKGSLRVDSRVALIAGGDRGTSLVANKPEESLLLHALRHDSELKMPPKEKLTAKEIDAVRVWIQAGAPWPDAVQTKVETKVAERVFSKEEKQFWAFQPVTRPAVPKVKTDVPIRNDIDRFLLAKLAEQGLTFSAPADRRTLLRRLTLDLTGLPPTPEEIASFEADPDPRAYEKAVERLLASPAYGEKWGRHWLDLARYSDSNGMDENLAYVNAWRYRDWVIRSLNKDKAYDQFVREQIAGDLIPGGDEIERSERLTGTGFLVIGPKMLAEDDPMKMRMDIIDEQLDTLGQTFLGLTMGCARCHDHKFDPITMQDYYGMAGILYSTKSMQNYKVVAAWNERAIGTPESIAAHGEYTKKLTALKAEVQKQERAARKLAQARIEEERKRVGQYLAAATEIQKSLRPLTLLAKDPVKNLPAGAIAAEAEAYTRGNVLKLQDGYGEGIGVIINAGPTPNVAEYDFEASRAGKYQLAIRYAAMESRPVTLHINGKQVGSEICAKVTGGWNPDAQQWHPEAIVSLKKGKNTLKFERDGAIPHLDRFVLLPLSNDEAKKLPLAIEEVAKEKKLMSALLRAWVDLLASRKGEAPAGEELKILTERPNGPFRVTRAVEEEVLPDSGKELKDLRTKLEGLEKTKPPVDEVMSVEDGKTENLRVHLRGSHLALGAEVPRRFLSIVSRDQQPKISAEHSGRLELANWITRPEHPLTARVMVNRIWAGHFGSGIVRSTDNFGKLGERPSHPELLDWLASEFVNSKWSIKAMHRLMVTSTAYRMSSKPQPSAFDKDPDNRLLSHFPRRRLEAEEIRDGMLAVSGLLDRKMGGTVMKMNPRQYVNNTASRNYDGYSHSRRSIYLPVIRSGGYDVLQTLDFPDPSVPMGQRTATIIPTQALLMLNSGLVDQSSEALAKAILKGNAEETERIRDAYRRILTRTATAMEVAKVREYLERSLAQQSDRPTEQRELQAWRGLCRILLASNEFVFVE